MLKGKNILIGITAGIAAYKICELIRMFKRQEANVRVITTPNALNLVSKLTLENLSNNEVYFDDYAVNEYKPEHISLCDEVDIMIIAPATANTISKIANGICDNLLTSTVSAFSKPIIIAPAMNTNMWNNTFIQENVKKLEQHSQYHIINPESGFLACGATGDGRLCKLEKIFDKTTEILSGKLKNKKIVITAGGTVEKIDPVRYISNFSSGKMGTAIADSAYSQGAEVVLVSTFPISRPYRVVQVESAIEMEKVVLKNLESDCIIMSAAVADYRIKEYNQQKMKKTQDDSIILELVKNPDILKEISQKKNKGIIVGFCAESENLLENAKTKIKNKGCDYLIANDISRKDIGFSSDENEVYILDKELNIAHLEKMPKTKLAEKILEKVFE